MEDAKLVKLRQTIRELIVPLVQCIHDEDPADITSFCLQYFEDLQKRCQKDVADVRPQDGSSSENADAAEHENENMASKSSLQGSASLPTIGENKDPGNLKLRETSSWNKPSTSKSLQPIEFNYLDAVSNIGDQGKTEAKDPDQAEFLNANMGDSCASLKEKPSSEDSDRASVAENVTVGDSVLCERNSPKVLASAPPLEKDHQNLTKVHSLNMGNDSSTNSENAVKTDVHLLPDSLSIEEGADAETYFDAQSSLECRKDIKCRGKISPTSSFGFIPDIQDLAISRCDQGIVDRVKDLEENLCDSNENLKQPSEALEHLVVSSGLVGTDGVSKLSEMEEVSDDLKVLIDLETVALNKEKPTANKKKVSFSKEIEEIILPAEEINDYSYQSGDLECSLNDSLGKDLAEGALDVSDLAGNNPIFINPADFVAVAEKKVADIGSNQESDPKVFDGHNASGPAFRNDKNKEDEPPPKLLLDESWIRNWYAVHPRLDNMEPSFSNPYGPEFGLNSGAEAGNPHGPRDRGGFTSSGRGIRTESYSESKLASYLAPSAAANDNGHGSYSADNIYYKGSLGRVACNFSRGLRNTKGDELGRNDKPFTWNEWAYNRLEQARLRNSDPQAPEEDQDNPSSENETGSEKLSEGKETETTTEASEELSTNSGNQGIACKRQRSRCSMSVSAESLAREGNIGDATIISENSLNSSSNGFPRNGSADNTISSSASQQPKASENGAIHHDGTNKAQEREADTLSDRPSLLEHHSSGPDGTGGGVNGSSNPENGPEVLAGPEKIEPGLNSAGGDFAVADGAAEVQDGATENEDGRDTDAPRADSNDSTSLTEDTGRPNQERITVEYFEEVMRDFIKEEELLPNEYQVLELEMCSGSDTSTVESNDEID